MNITFISDTHGKHDMITDDLIGGPIIIHAGDVSGMGTIREINNFLDWFSDLPYFHKIFIAGNHDFGFEEKRHLREDGIRIPDGITYLQDEEVTIEGIKIYGSPWQPKFFDWAFMLDRGEKLREKWEKIPKDVDILITHGPPYSILDRTQEGLNVGCEDLYDKLQEIKPKIHVFGHIHEGYGMRDHNDITFINASVLNRRYMYTNKPVVVEY